MSKTILVTGGAGFIGSNFIKFFMNQHPEYHLINVDKLTYAGSTDKLNSVNHLENYHFIQGDLADKDFVNRIFADYNIDGVIHFAAESHVDRSIEDASSFIDSNITGTANLLQAARDSWEAKGELTTRRFHHISTDEVYGTLGEDGKFHENTPYNPRNPYSASKASANMLVKSFGYTYGMNVIISSSSNNYGPAQHEEKLIPTIISRALNDETIPIYGDGKNIRDWLYVEDHCRALDQIFHQAECLETYNIGGGNEIKNIDIAMTICGILDHLKPEYHSHKELIRFTADRLGHDRRYAVDDSKLRNTLGWEPIVELETGLKNTVEWYVDRWEKVTQ